MKSPSLAERTKGLSALMTRRSGPSRAGPSPEGCIKQIIQCIGDDPDRNGLLSTPDRIVRSWSELYKGYSIDPVEQMTFFDIGDGEQYDEIILLKDIEMYSMCEHHMLPFFGKAHVAYLPGTKLLGISKLARLVEAYSRRLQIQERIGRQVVDFLMEHTEALGAACIIEASHMCIQMRGVQKQNSVMVTSSMEGVFLNDGQARSELMSMIHSK